MSDHVADRAALLAALPPGDPEARLAREHARGCAECARALDDGRKLAALLDALPRPPAPEPAVLQRIAGAVVSDLRSEGRRAPAVAPAVAVVASWALEVAMARHRDLSGDRPLVAGAALLCAVGLGALSGVRARTAVLSALAASVAFAALVASSSGLSPALGVKCTAFELLAAVLPLAIAVRLARRRGAPLGAWSGAGIATAAALAGQAALHLSCEASTETAHLLVFHAGGVALAALAGLGVARVTATATHAAT